MNYWCYRIDKSKIKYFVNELNEGRLRQGWGWDVRQDLRDYKMDSGASRNRPMFSKVKKGDILLVPQLPNWGEVALVKATEDWNTGYKFDIDTTYSDYGHIFPAEYIKSFSRGNQNVTGGLRSTLKNPSRFWNINHYAADVDKLIATEKSELSKDQDHKSRFESSIGSVFNEVFNDDEFSNKLYTKLTEQFSREEWEFALIHGLRKKFPHYEIRRVGGKEEKNHGADILIKIPGIISNYSYGIAIQVKDYSGSVGNEVINQINKSEAYWDDETLKLIERIVIITKAEKSDSPHLMEYDTNVKIIFANELKQLLAEIGKKYIGIQQL